MIFTNIMGQSPAFPSPSKPGLMGLTKHEYFAGQALKGLLVGLSPNWRTSDLVDLGPVSKGCLAWADAMLKAYEDREKAVASAQESDGGDFGKA